MSTSRTATTWRERLASPLTWHFAGFAVLLVLAVGLAIRLALDWTAMDSHSSEVLAGKQVELRALEFQTAPLRGIDQRVDKSREQMQAFDKKRIPANYSLISSRIGDLEVASGVRLSRVQYTQGKPDAGLTEISMDAGISGDYSSIMRFVNSVERDQTFFIIRAMTLTGQQSGQVNLRMQLSTWLRPEDVPIGLPATPEPGETPATPAIAAREGE
jgi:Tfp pilus assembly protein PilO